MFSGKNFKKINDSAGIQSINGELLTSITSIGSYSTVSGDINKPICFDDH